MHKRRISEEVMNLTEGFNRKKLSSKFINRITQSNEPLCSTTKIDRKVINLKVVPNEVSIASIIQEKVTNLKNKFGELDDMRKKLIESRCEVRESDKTGLEKIRGKSSESNPEAIFHKEFSVTRQSFERNFSNTLVFDKNTKYSRQKNPDHEKKKLSLCSEGKETLKNDSEALKVNKLCLEIENKNLKITNLQNELKESEKTKKIQETQISSQNSEIKALESQLKSSNSTIKSLKHQLNKLDSKIKNSSENNSTIKNLSYIILSKDSPTRVESSYSLIVNKYFEALNELQKSDNFLLKILKSLDNNKVKQAHLKLLKAKEEILLRNQRSAKGLEELERFICENRSPTPSKTQNFSKSPNFSSETQEKNSQKLKKIQNSTKTDLINWMKCQACTIEDLLMISSV